MQTADISAVYQRMPMSWVPRKRQLSCRRAALRIAGFDGLNGDQLLSIAQQDRDANQQPTALPLKVSRFLSANNRDYIPAVGFLSRGALRPVTDGVVDSFGTLYFLPKRESSFWHADLSGLFEWRNPPDTGLPAPPIAA